LLAISAAASAHDFLVTNNTQIRGFDAALEEESQRPTKDRAGEVRIGEIRILGDGP